jgi:pimeloyl-ACP methyl ester carboxylesterase
LHCTGRQTTGACEFSVSRSTDESAPRTGATIVAELHEVLKQTGVRPPYVLVGHSLGGLYASLYAGTYPEEVAGLVLLDSMHPEQIERCQQYLPAKECDPELVIQAIKDLVMQVRQKEIPPEI